MKGKRMFRAQQALLAAAVVAGIFAAPTLTLATELQTTTSTSGKTVSTTKQSAAKKTATTQSTTQSTNQTTSSSSKTPSASTSSSTTSSTNSSTSSSKPPTSTSSSTSSSKPADKPAATAPSSQAPSAPKASDSVKEEKKESSESKAEEKEKDEVPPQTDLSDKGEDPEPVFYENQTTKEFIELIGKDAQQIAFDNDLYASVMIAQAILESASGNSQLARGPNFNLFGIKGEYKGSSVTFDTKEDNGSGELYSVEAAFRKYPSVKESLEDYAALLQNDIYSGARKSNTETYKDATRHLTGRYATSIHYYKSLDALIDTYDLTQYDSEPGKEAESKAEAKKTVPEKNTTSKKKGSAVTAEDWKDGIIYQVKGDENLWEIAKNHQLDVQDIMRVNGLSTSVVKEGQELLLPK